MLIQYAYMHAGCRVPSVNVSTAITITIKVVYLLCELPIPPQPTITDETA